MVKDYLIKWNREAKDYIEERIKENREYLSKSHRVNCHSKLLSIGALISAIAAIIAGYKFFTTTITEQNALYYLLVFVGFGLVSITNSVVNSFHSRKLRSYDAQMEKLDDLYHKYVDHTFDIEAYALRKVEKKHLCTLPLKKINIISTSVDRFDILDYALSEKYTSNRKYWFLKLLAFVGFVASLVSLILLLL